MLMLGAFALVRRRPGRARSTFSDPSSDNEEDLERLRERPRRFSYVMDRELFEEATDEFRKVSPLLVTLCFCGATCAGKP